MTQDAAPLVSIIITTHNRKDLICDAIASAKSQTYNPTEIIVVDDGSSDGTAEVLERVQARDPSIRVIRHPEPLGGNAARNSGIRMARGKFVAGLDDDDTFIENHIELLMKIYSPVYSFVAGQALEFSTKGASQTKFHGLVSRELITLYNAVGNQALIERIRLISVGLYDETMPRYQDHDMWIRLIDRYGPALVIPAVTQRIRVGNKASKLQNNQKNLQGASILLSKHSDKMSSLARIALLLRIAAYRPSISLVRPLVDVACRLLIKFDLMRIRLNSRSKEER